MARYSYRVRFYFAHLSLRRNVVQVLLENAWGEREGKGEEREGRCVGCREEKCERGVRERGETEREGRRRTRRGEGTGERGGGEERGEARGERRERSEREKGERRGRPREHGCGREE